MMDASATPESPVKPMLVATNQGDRDLSIIDPVAAKQLATVPEGGITGHEVATSPDGRTAYVPIYGSSGVGKPGTDGHEMVVIDIPSRQVTGKVDFGHGVRPHCPVYDRASGMLYVTTELDQTVTIIDPKTLKIVGTVPTGQKESHMLVISRDGQRGYTSNVGAGSVSVLDLPGRKTIAIIPISSESQRIAISNDDKMVFTSDQTKPQLAVIDTATNKIKTWVPLPAVGYGTSPTPDGRFLLVAMPKANQLAVVDLATLKVVRDRRCSRRPGQGARPPGRQGCVCLLLQGEAGRGGRSVAVEGGFADRCRQGRRWPGLGGARDPERPALPSPDGAWDANRRVVSQVTSGSWNAGLRTPLAERAYRSRSHDGLSGNVGFLRQARPRSVLP